MVTCAPVSHLMKMSTSLQPFMQKGRGVTLGAAIGEMVRKATSAPRSESGTRRLIQAPNGLLIAAPSGRVITNKMVKRALEEDDE